MDFADKDFSVFTEGGTVIVPIRAGKTINAAVHATGARAIGKYFAMSTQELIHQL